MKQTIYTLILTSAVISGCAKSPIVELNDYRNEASERCSGKSYKASLGTNWDSNFNTSASISEKLLQKGYGTGSLKIGVSLIEKTELSSILGGLTKTQVENFLNKYESCMTQEMVEFYKVKKLEYPVKPTTTSILWNKTINTASETIIANQTEHSGNWRAYEACVSIPSNALMLQKTVKTEVIKGVPAGSWGTWRKDIKFVNNNSYGPTKVCRGFDHQIHDQDRTLRISVKYKLPYREVYTANE